MHYRHWRKTISRLFEAVWQGLSWQFSMRGKYDQELTHQALTILWERSCRTMDILSKTLLDERSHFDVCCELSRRIHKGELEEITNEIRHQSCVL